MRCSPRLWALISSVVILSSLAGKPAFAADNVVFIFGGDVEWSLNARPPTVRYRVSDPAPYGRVVYGRRDVRDQVTGDWPPIPYIDQGESGAYLKSLGLKGPNDASTGESLSYQLQEREEYAKDYSTDDGLLNYPLQRLAPIFHGADLVMVNCEGALSDHGRQVGLNRTPERFAISMRNAGISLVNLANNHTFDAEERGFLDTLRAAQSPQCCRTMSCSSDTTEGIPAPQARRLWRSSQTDYACNSSQEFSLTSYNQILVLASTSFPTFIRNRRPEKAVRLRSPASSRPASDIPGAQKPAHSLDCSPRKPILSLGD
jgi:hypothetical protein